MGTSILTTSDSNLAINFEGAFQNSLTTNFDLNAQVQDVPTIIPFDGAKGGPSDPVESDAGGTITVNQARSYNLLLTMNVGRSISGSTVGLFADLLINGTIRQPPFHVITLEGATTGVYGIFRFVTTVLLPTTTIAFEVWTDSAIGSDNIELLPSSVVFGAGITPAFAVEMSSNYAID